MTAVANTIPQLQWVHGPITVVMWEAETLGTAEEMLQWVHGPITVVMNYRHLRNSPIDGLQWVHGPITVVMQDDEVLARRLVDASMGPRSDNRGYDERAHQSSAPPELQWVHGPITVVMGLKVEKVLEPWEMLQWVHGPITVVMTLGNGKTVYAKKLQWVHGPITVVMVGDLCPHGPIASSFNGSTVR